jgi:hypothetical protein
LLESSHGAVEGPTGDHREVTAVDGERDSIAFAISGSRIGCGVDGVQAILGIDGHHRQSGRTAGHEFVSF